jgi:threonine/homoserine/homoserine lactone efflux protein
MISLSFIVASILILLAPGPTNTVLATCGAAMGFRRAAFLTLAAALGYLVAVSIFASFASLFGGNSLALVAVKLAAALWLSYSACRLWMMPFDLKDTAPRDSFVRVLLTTMVNPKAMLVGTVLIPADKGGVAVWIGTFAALAAVTGLGWIRLGAWLPLGIRRHAYKLAAVVLGGFSVAAVASTLG